MTNSLNNSHKLTIPDLITIGVFTALYFVLVITHDDELAVGWCDRVIYLEDNK